MFIVNFVEAAEESKENLQNHGLYCYALYEQSF